MKAFWRKLLRSKASDGSGHSVLVRVCTTHYALHSDMPSSLESGVMFRKVCILVDISMDQ